MTRLDLVRVGAVTPLGLSAASTCAAFRAGLKGLVEVSQRLLPDDAVVGGRVPASTRLRNVHAVWLVNLATRALAEIVDGLPRCGLILNLPERARLEAETYPSIFLSELQRRTGVAFAYAEASANGRAGAILGLREAHRLLSSDHLRSVIVGGVDSLVEDAQINSLSEAGRLYERNRGTGIMPAEGAAFLYLMRPGVEAAPLASILGVGNAIVSAESRVSQAVGLRASFEAALDDAGVREADIAFVVTDQNGVRSRELDYVMAEMRTFRTIRATMPHWRFAASAGDIPAAAGALPVILAATAIAKGYAPGALALCAASSDDGVHAAAVIGPGQSALGS